MTTLRILGFSGEIPKLVPRLLPDMSAQEAYNVRLDDGALTPTRKSKRVHTFPNNEGLTYQTIYRHLDEWLGWDTVVNAVPGPVAQDRLYFTGDGVPKMMVGEDVYPLAVPYPTQKLTGAVSGSGSGTPQTRLYVYTFVTEFGEESEPSPISDDIEWQLGQTVTLSGFELPPPGRAITKQRIYRSQTGGLGTELFFIAERDATDDDFVDDLDPEAIQEPLPSRLWNAPPDDLEGLISMPNGMMVGYVGKDIYFCEPYRPHAWPEGYVLTVDYNIMGLGAFDNTLVIVTEGQPYIASGISPETMTLSKLELNLPCINKRSVQDLGYAVVYASHEGLVSVSAGGARVVTEQLISRTEWMKLDPYTVVSGQFQGRYYASYRYIDQYLEEHKGTIIIDMSGEMPFIIRSDISPKAYYYSIRDGALYYLKEGSVFEYDARREINNIMAWKSKLFVLPRPTNFGAILIEVDYELSSDDVAAIQEAIEQIKQENQAIVASGNLGGALNGSALNVYPVNGDAITIPPSFSQFASVAIYADRKLVAVVNGINEMCRLPSGFLARQWEVEVTGDARISQISLATTGAELMAV